MNDVKHIAWGPLCVCVCVCVCIYIYIYIHTYYINIYASREINSLITLITQVQIIIFEVHVTVHR
jgi:hypothetical protein